MRCARYVVGFWFGLTTVLSGQTAPRPAEPRMSVLLETDALAANDMLRGRLWLENPDTLSLSTATVQWAGPSFLEIGKPNGTRCDVVGSQISLAPVPAKSVTSLDLCVKSARVVVEGTFTVGFNLVYGKRDSVPTSYVLVEKPLRIGLFGSDTVAGVSLRLASFVVPGLLFFFVLQLGNVTRVATLDSLKLSTFSVVFSLLLTGIAAAALPPTQARGISILRFAGLCAVAVVIAAFVLGVIRWRQNTASRRKVGGSDDEIVALTKALSVKGPLRSPVTLTLADGQEFIGSASAGRPEGGTALLGWFEVSLPATLSTADRDDLKAMARNRDYAPLLRRLKELKVEPTLLNGIRERKAGVISDVDGAPSIRRYAAADVQATVAGAVVGVSENEPIKVV